MQLFNQKRNQYQIQAAYQVGRIPIMNKHLIQFQAVILIMYNNNLSKLKKPKIKPIQVQPNRQPAEIAKLILQRNSIKLHRNSTDIPTENLPYNVLSRKSIQYEHFATSGNTSVTINADRTKSYLEKKLTVKDFNKSRNISHIRYQDLVDNKHKTPNIRANRYSMQKEVVPRQGHLLKSNKNRSGNLSKEFSPGLNPHPKSSMSNPYQSEKKHKRSYMLSRNSTKQIHQQHFYENVLEEGKRYYKQSNHAKAIEIFKTILKNKNMLQAKYLLGICYMNTCDYQNGLSVFQQLIDENPRYKKNIYLLGAIAYKKLNKINDSIRILTQALTVYEDYDCRIYRGKLYLKQSHYLKALQDFTEAIQINPDKGFGYLGKADCLKGLCDLKAAIKTLTMGLKTDSHRACLLKRGIFNYQCQQYRQALVDFSNLLKGEPSNSEAFYYRGMIYYHLKNIPESILNFEECLKNDNNQAYIIMAIEQMLRIHLEDKDYYGAYHLACRAESFEIGKNLLEDWKIYIQAALYLMKKKFSEGIELFNTLLNKKGYTRKYADLTEQKQKKRFIFLKPLIHLYKAYGHFCLGQLKEAQKCYIQFDQYHIEMKIPQNQASKSYNVLLLKAIQNFPISQQYLCQAITFYSNKTEPYFYLAITYTQKYIETENIEYLDKIKSNFDLAISYLPHLSNNHISNVYYMRAVIYLYTQEYDKAAADVDKAIQKSEDNIPKYFYLRGMIFACCGSFNTAIQDFNVCINLNQKFAKAYLERAKCLQLNGSPNQAFIDLQKYITLKPEDPNINKYAGFLLFENYSFEDCIQAFSHGATVLNDPEILLTKAKCYFLLGKLDKAVENFELYHHESKDKSYLVDSIIVNLLKNIEQSTKPQKFNMCVEMITNLIDNRKHQGKIFRLPDMLIIRGAAHCCNQQFQLASEDFREALRLKRIEKATEKQINFASQLDDDEYVWGIFEVHYCLAICLLAQKKYQQSLALLKKSQFEDEEDVTYNIQKFSKFVQQLTKECALENHSNAPRQFILTNKKALSQYFPGISLQNESSKETFCIYLSFSYPEVEPPSLVPEFDHEIFLEFIPKNIEYKPEAPWISRGSEGVVFTNNIQTYDNLELSVTSINKNSESTQNNKELQYDRSSLSLQRPDVEIKRDQIKKHFKLDSETQMKLKKLLGKH